jgi:hypothetical protein
MKVDYVELSPRDLELLIDVVQMVVDYKFRSLMPHNWTEFESTYLPKLVDQISRNQFKVVDANNNTMIWLIDNIVHSRKVVEGIPKRDWIPLADIDRVQECLTMLRSASRGPVSYKTSKAGQQFTNLFSK